MVACYRAPTTWHSGKEGYRGGLSFPLSFLFFISFPPFPPSFISVFRKIALSCWAATSLWEWSGSKSHSVKSDSLRPVDCSPPGSSVRGILQARMLEWVAIAFCRGSSWPRDQTFLRSEVLCYSLLSSLVSGDAWSRSSQWDVSRESKPTDEVRGNSVFCWLAVYQLWSSLASIEKTLGCWFFMVSRLRRVSDSGIRQKSTH